MKEDAVYANFFHPDRSREIVLPGIATGVGAIMVPNGAALTYGIWIDIALPGAITVPTLVVGVCFDTVFAAGEIFTVDIGSAVGYANAAAVTAAGAPAIAAAHRKEVRICAITAVTYVPIYFPFPIFYPIGAGIIGRSYTVSGGAGDVISVSVLCRQLVY